jgi:hypothetical protein
VVTCSRTNQYKDLFYALGNSYGTLGYVLRAKIKLRKVLPYMVLSTKRFNSTKALISGLKSAVNDPLNDSVESLVYSKNELYMTTVKQAKTPKNLISIYKDNVFYREISKPGQISLKTRDFAFRYDPEWFWNMPNEPAFQLFRKFAPQSIRNSGFYTKYGHYLAGKSGEEQKEMLIQDWEVPWKYADSLLNFVLTTVDLLGLPILLSPIKIPEKATIYPMKTGKLYLNLGSYSFVRKRAGKEAYYNTLQIDKFCFAHEGIKMLYSSTFLTEKEFDKIYNGKAYKKLKNKYDKKTLLPTLFEKAVKSH